MSRSYRKSPFMGITCCKSEKDDKRIANRRYRRRLRISIFNEIQPMIREVSNVYLFGKDGRQFITDSKWLRK
jgi:hypothetical protein